MGNIETRRAKVCLLGDPAVGKTSMIRKYVTDKFDDKYIATVGTKVTKKIITLTKGPERTIQITLMIWDILGQRRFSKLHASFYNGARGIIVVSDLTRPETFKSMGEWITAVFGSTGTIPVILVGNKIDLLDPSTVDVQPLRELAQTHHTNFFLASAKTGQNVEKTFLSLANAISQ